jgi:molybdopterin-guanine dinucleotide biosynthesis protein A
MTHCEPIDGSSATLVILAGGQGGRMGIPKAWIQLARKPILEWLLDRMQWTGPTMLVSAPAVAHPPGSGLFDCEVVDPVDGLGPLRGLLTALEHLSTPLMGAITVDMPGVSPVVLAWLIEALARRPDHDGVMCHVNAAVAGHVEPFPSAFRSEAARSIAQSLDAGRRSVQDLHLHSGFLVLEAPPEWPASTWTNLNTPSELAAFETTLTDG